MSDLYIKAGVGTDIDAQAFITAANITLQSQKDTIDILCKSLKIYNLWNKIKAIYPMIGGVASSHSYNLKNISQYQLTFFGGWVHSSTGAAPNGTNAYADTNLNISTQYTNYLNSHHLSFYSRTIIPTGSGWNIGVGNSATGDPLFGLSLRRSISSTNQFIYDFGNVSNNGRLTEIPSITGLVEADNFFCGSATSTTFRQFRKSSKIRLSSNLTVSGTTSNANIYLGALNPYPAGSFFYMSNECAFCTIGDGLTTDEIQVLYGIIHTFNSSLNRSV